MNGAKIYRKSIEFKSKMELSRSKHGVAGSPMQAKAKIDVPGRIWDKGNPMPLCTAVERML